jgi:competence protein ComEC
VPLAPLFAAASLGIVVDRFAGSWATRDWAALALACAGLAVLTFRRAIVSSLALVGAFGALGGGWHHSWWSDRVRDDLARTVTEAPQPAWLRGMVRDVLGVRPSERPPFETGLAPEASGPARVRSRFVVDLTAASDGRRWHPVSGRALMIVAGDRREVGAGEAIEVVGQLAKVPRPLNPGEFDYRGFLRGQGIDLRLVVNDASALTRDPGGAGGVFLRWLGRLRVRSRAQLAAGLAPATVPLAAALLLGQREEVDPEVNDAFARTGTTHLLAVSGLQLQVLAAALLVAFRALGLARRPSYLAVGLGTIGYAILVGPAPSVVRSTVMTVTFCLAALVQRAARPANTLALAALGTLAINPVYLFDVGCQLSFLAIAALVWLVPPACRLSRRIPAAIRARLLGPPSPLDELERRLEPGWRRGLRRAGGWLGDGVVASTVVWLAALPLVALRFHLVSPIGILLNIPLIPLTSGALLLGALGLGLSALGGPLAGPAFSGAGGLLEVTRQVVLWGVGQPWGHRFAVGPAWGWVLVFYGLLGLAAVSATAAARPTRAGRVVRAGIWGLLVLWALPGWLLSGLATQSTTPEAEVLAVGHGLAVIIRIPGGQTLLYDCGRLGDPSVGRRLIAPALWARGIGRIDAVILSHADQDHYDGLPDLLDRFPIGAVRIPPGFGGPANPGVVRLLDQVRARGVPIAPIAALESWESGGVRFTVHHPPPGWQPEASDNARSLVLDVAHEGRHLLLTGDLEQSGLVELLAAPRPEPPPEVLLAPHHGGKSANPASLYRWANPRIVVVSQRPPIPGSNDALSALERQGIPIWRSWREGAIRLRWTRQGIVARGYLEGDTRRLEANDSPQDAGAPHPSVQEAVDFDRHPLDVIMRLIPSQERAPWPVRISHASRPRSTNSRSPSNSGSWSAWRGASASDRINPRIRESENSERWRRTRRSSGNCGKSRRNSA